MRELIIASNNKKKIEEIKNILKGLPYTVLSLKDKGIDIDVEEDGKTFEENAMKKSLEIYEFLKKKESGFFVLSDDSGIEVDYLNGEPGIYSARYAGEHGNDKANNEKLLYKLKGIEKSDRTGRFVCSISLVDSHGKCYSVRGETEGYILEEHVGENGFGYDPIFFSNALNKSFGIATAEEKNNISHRGKALEKVRLILEKL